MGHREPEFSRIQKVKRTTDLAEVAGLETTPNEDSREANGITKQTELINTGAER